MNKIHGKGKLILYAFSGMGINMLNLMMGSYLCSAIIASGFGNEAKPFQTYTGNDLVVLGVWAIFALFAKILDGVIDIPMASLTDNLRTRFGRRRPSIVIGMIPLIISYLLFLVIPTPTQSILNTVYYGIVLCVFYSFYTLTMVTYYSTFTEIVETNGERNFLSNAKSVFDIVYFILGYVVVRMFLNGTNIRVVALYVLPIALTMIIPLFMIKEPDMRNNTEIVEKVEKISLIKSLAYTFKNKRFIAWMVVYSFMTLGVQLFLSGINEYFSVAGMSMIIVMVSAFAPVPLTLMIYDKILVKRGFGAAFRYTLITFTIGMLTMCGVSFIDAGLLKTILSVVAGLISSLAIGSMFSVAYSVPSQLAADEEKEKGTSNSAMYFAVQGLFAGVATGIGSGVILTFLKDSKNVMFMTIICAVAAIVSFILTYILPESVIKMGKKDK